MSQYLTKTKGLWSGFVFTLLLYVPIYYETFNHLKNKWHGDYSYAYLIPIIFFYIVWENREILRRTSIQPSISGAGLVLFGHFLYWVGELGGEWFTLYLSSWVTLLGIAVFFFGIHFIKKIWFAFFILLTMFRLPHFIYDNLTLNLKLISSKLGVVFMQLMGMTAYREGNIIDLGFTQLQVVDACSGLRYLIPLVVLALILVYFLNGSRIKKLFLLATTAPLSIFTNSMRIALTGILYEAWGPKVAEGFFHGFSGWFIFMFSFIVLLLEIWVLGKLPGGKLVMRREKGGEAGSDPGPEVSGFSQPVATGKTGFLFTAPFVFLFTVMCATLVLSNTVEFREKVLLNKPLNQFPTSISDWSGKRQTMEKKFIEELDFTDYAVIDYKNPSGQNINLYVAYYESQKKGESIHSPATCLPGGGWVFKSAGEEIISIPSENFGEIRVNRAYMQKMDVRQLTYYWFPSRGRVLTNVYEMKIFNFWDALIRKRTDGALVRLITLVYPNEEVEDADRRLQAFAKECVPVLKEFLPQ